MTVKEDFNDHAPPQWIRNTDPDSMRFGDGDIFLIAVLVKDDAKKKVYWDIAKVRIICDEDFFQMVLADSEESESYDAWDWYDVEYYIKLEE